VGLGVLGSGEMCGASGTSPSVPDMKRGASHTPHLRLAQLGLPPVGPAHAGGKIKAAAGELAAECSHQRGGALGGGVREEDRVGQRKERVGGRIRASLKQKRSGVHKPVSAAKTSWRSCKGCISTPKSMYIISTTF
jgi:hypothetical protein